MQPLPLNAQPFLPQAVGVLTDIDDTLTTDGAITPDALQALADLQDAGLTVLAITGRPVGWSQPFALQWPLRAIVAENGAVALQKVNAQTGRWPSPPGGPGALAKHYQADGPTRAANYQRLQAVAQRVLREVPQARLAQDSPGRETDIAIDHSEFAHLTPAQIETVAAIARAEGLQVTVSSIHINAWLGQHNKWQGACWALRTLLGVDLAADIDRWVYIGDSTNDQVMFQHFTHSVGVANIRRFENQLQHLPRYITPAERGAGFAQLAQALLAGR